MHAGLGRPMHCPERTRTLTQCLLLPRTGSYDIAESEHRTSFYTTTSPCVSSPALADRTGHVGTFVFRVL
jgi:hypothetical protein